MTATRPGGGTLIAKFLVGLLFLVVGLAIMLVGVFNQGAVLILLGGLIAAVGLILIVLKIIARNRPL
ncbi:hypothetical protein [Brevundimonas lenta]|uniref:Uncharacterized protein n=1 Tax=Brevundimonas lenta TaxID=424796 RepID=A0A7W6JCK0_9CAUL|nr:hypothetical protein [Brevundimonas lenta]MBB4082629.1 hypothetical protein [Brevundimonas lenta]